MKRVFRHIFFLILVIACAVGVIYAVGITVIKDKRISPHTESGSMILYNCNIVDTNCGEVLYGQTVVVEDGMIVKISPSKKMMEKGEIDLTGKYIMPGLIDSHVHWANFAADSSESAALSGLYLKNGVTTVRDVGGNVLKIKEYKRQIATGAYPGPEIYYSAFWTKDPQTFSSDFVCGWSGEENTCPWARLFSVADSADAAIEKGVMEAKECGCTGFKIYAGYSAAELARMIPIMKKHGMKVWGHASQGEAAKAMDVACCGMEVLSHAYLLADDFNGDVAFDGEKRGYVEKVCSEMAHNGAVLDITAHISMENGILYSRDIIMEAYKAGVKFVVGTDYPDCVVHEEIKHLKDCGIENADILRAATVTAADILGEAGRLGIIAEGAQADILVLDENPAEDLSILDNINMVILNGRLWYR